MPPSPRNEAAGSLARNDYMSPTGQANLTPMRVPAQLQRKTVGCGFGIGFWTVREENHKRILRSFFSRPGEIVCLKIMRVVHSRDPQGITAAPDFRRFVQENRNPVPLEVQHHFQGIMIPKDAPAIGCQCLPELGHSPHGVTMVSVHAIPVVTREDRRVVRGLMDQINHDRHEGGFQIAVQVGEMQETKSLEGRG